VTASGHPVDFRQSMISVECSKFYSPGNCVLVAFTNGLKPFAQNDDKPSGKNKIGIPGLKSKPQKRLQAEFENLIILRIWYTGPQTRMDIGFA
jgi:hypothetical protein